MVSVVHGHGCCIGVAVQVHLVAIVPHGVSFRAEVQLGIGAVGLGFEGEDAVFFFLAGGHAQQHGHHG